MINSTLQAERAMANAASYAEWAEAARRHDQLSGAQRWKTSRATSKYDYTAVGGRLTRLQSLRDHQDNDGLLFELNEGIHGNMDGMGNERLFNTAAFGSKQLINDYVDTIVECLNHLAREDGDGIDYETKLDFFRRASHCYGRSALLLSGSGSFLYFHLGVVKALWEEKLLPSIISGSSGGSVVGSMVCTHTDQDMQELFDPERHIADEHITPSEKRIGPISFKMYGLEQFDAIFGGLIPDMTFQEAYERTGRHLSISVAPAEKHQNSRLLNAITSPNVLIRDAAKASGAIPGIFSPITLAARNSRGEKVLYHASRRWVDGTVSDDIPIKRLARLYGVNHHIVSQANPVIAGLASSTKRKTSSAAIIRGAALSAGKALLNMGTELLQRPLSRSTFLNSASGIFMSLINQNFTGDINIIRPHYKLPLHKMLGLLPVNDIAALIKLGERVTWPRIEMIRTQTKISITLQQILSTYYNEMVKEHEILHPHTVRSKTRPTASARIKRKALEHDLS